MYIDTLHTSEFPQKRILFRGARLRNNIFGVFLPTWIHEQKQPNTPEGK